MNPNAKGCVVIPFRRREPATSEHSGDLASMLPKGPAVVIILPPPGPNPNHITLEETAELMSCHAAIAKLHCAVAEQADPANGQLDRIGRTPDGHDYFVVVHTPPGEERAIPPLYRRTVFEKIGGEWFVWHRPTSPAYDRGWGWRHETLREALEIHYGTVAKGWRPARPDDPPGGYPQRGCYGDTAPRLPLPERWRRRTWDGSRGLDRAARRR